MHSESEILMLGTGHAGVTECYNTCFLLSVGSDKLLVDGGGGNGILRQFKHAGVGFPSLSAIFITHAHTDHILGVLWVVRMLCMHIFKHPDFSLPVYGCQKCIDTLKWLCANTLSPRYNNAIAQGIRFITISNGQKVKIGSELEVEFFDMQSKNEPQFGFLTNLPNGKRLVCMGDEPIPVQLYPLAKNADWLMCEAYCLDAEQHIFHPHEKWHGTVKETAQTAQNLEVKNLLLYHTEDSDLENRKKRYSEEASSEFSGHTWVPDDLETLSL